jgi:asparagine synthase (glutamine-hydrolysing)
MGFSVPVAEWLRGPLREWAGEVLHSRYPDELDPVSAERYRRSWQHHQAGRTDEGNALWAMAVYLRWRDESKSFF